MANQNATERLFSPRFVLALFVSLAAFGAIIGFGVTYVLKTTDHGTAANSVLTMTLPVFGTWVATVLAYYFHKENLDAATRSMDTVINRLSPQEVLRSARVTEKMIPKAKIVHGHLPPETINLSAVLKELSVKGKGDRYPVFDESDRLIVMMIHRSRIADYLADQALKGVSSADLEKKTLKDILDDPDDNKKYGDIFRNSFATVGEQATLLDVKNKMDNTPDCQDVFVTSGGTKDDEVLGWITNVILAANSKV